MKLIPCTSEVMTIFATEVNELIELRNDGDALSGFIEGVGIFTLTDKAFLEDLVHNFIGGHFILICDYSNLEFFEVTA